jgi:hypothetical protein
MCFEMFETDFSDRVLQCIVVIILPFQPIMDIVKVEPESDDETQPVDSEKEAEVTKARQDGLGTFTFVSVKEESVSVVLLHVIQI